MHMLFPLYIKVEADLSRGKSTTLRLKDISLREYKDDALGFPTSYKLLNDFVVSSFYFHLECYLLECYCTSFSISLSRDTYTWKIVKTSIIIIMVFGKIR